MPTIPIISSAADLPGAIRHGNREENARWYITKRAHALGCGNQVPAEWGITAAFGGDWTPPQRDKAAGKGQAQSDGSFPIKDKADLKRAIQAYGRSKDKAKTKKHIISRAKALGLTSELPDDWKSGVTASATRRLPHRQGTGKIEAMTAAGWDNNVHPRDRNGRFIEKLDLISVFSVTGGSEVQFQGKAVGNGHDASGDYIEVQHDSGIGQQITRVPVSRIESAPESKARLDTPPNPDAAAPDAPAPEDGIDDSAGEMPGQPPAPEGVDPKAWELANAHSMEGWDLDGEDKSHAQSIADEGGVDFQDLKTAADAIEHPDQSGGVDDSAGEMPAGDPGDADPDLAPDVQEYLNSVLDSLEEAGATDDELEQITEEDIHDAMARDFTPDEAAEDLGAKYDMTISTPDDEVDSMVEDGDLGEYTPEEIDKMASHYENIGRADLAKRIQQAFTDAGGYDNEEPQYDSTDEDVQNWLDDNTEGMYAKDITDDADFNELVHKAESDGIDPDMVADKLREWINNADGADGSEPGPPSDGSDIGSGTLEASDLGVKLSQTSMEDLQPIRDLLDVDSGSGGWASGMNDITMQNMIDSVDNYLEDPDSIPSMYSERLDEVSRFAEEHGISDLTDVINTRMRAHQLGWSQEEQIRGVLNGEPLEEFNPAALRNISDFLNNNALTHHSFGESSDGHTMEELAGDIYEFLDGAYDEKPAGAPDAPADNREDYWGGYASGPFLDLSPADQKALRGQYDQMVDSGVNPIQALDRLASPRAAASDRAARDRATKDGDPDGTNYVDGFANALSDEFTDAHKQRIRDAFSTGWDEQGPALGLERASKERDAIAKEIAAAREMPTPASDGGVPVGDKKTLDQILLMARSADKESVDHNRADAESELRTLIDKAHTGESSTEDAHKDMAKLMTRLKLGGKQRKRYRELLDSYFGSSGSDDNSAAVEAQATADSLSADNPVKEKLAAKAKQLAANPPSATSPAVDTSSNSAPQAAKANTDFSPGKTVFWLNSGGGLEYGTVESITPSSGKVRVSTIAANGKGKSVKAFDPSRLSTSSHDIPPFGGANPPSATSPAVDLSSNSAPQAVKKKKYAQQDRVTIDGEDGVYDVVGQSIDPGYTVVGLGSNLGAKRKVKTSDLSLAPAKPSTGNAKPELDSRMAEAQARVDARNQAAAKAKGMTDAELDAEIAKEEAHGNQLSKDASPFAKLSFARYTALRNEKDSRAGAAKEAAKSDDQLLADAQANWDEAKQEGYMVGNVVDTVRFRLESVLEDLRAGDQSITVKDDVEQSLSRAQALAALRKLGVPTTEFESPGKA